jgi:hypothetical protein
MHRHPRQMAPQDCNMHTQPTPRRHNRFKWLADRPLLIWASVLFVAMFSFFVHTVAAGVDRAELARAGLSLATAR